MAGRFYFLITLLICQHLLTAQGEYTNYTMEDGLPSNTVYKVFQSTTGYLWLCTDAGLSRYNGNEFVNFTTEDGLPDNEIFDLFEDSKGRIWMFSYNGKIGYIENEIQFKSRVIDTTHFQGRISHIDEDKDGNVLLSSVKGGMVTLDENLQVKKMETGQESVQYFYFDDKERLIFLNPNIFLFEGGKSTQIKFRSQIEESSNKFLKRNNRVYFFNISALSAEILDAKDHDHLGKLSVKSPLYNIQEIGNQLFFFTKNGVVDEDGKIIEEIPHSTSLIVVNKSIRCYSSLKKGLFVFNKLPLKKAMVLGGIPIARLQKTYNELQIVGSESNNKNFKYGFKTEFLSKLDQKQFIAAFYHPGFVNNSLRFSDFQMEELSKPNDYASRVHRIWGDSLIVGQEITDGTIQSFHKDNMGNLWFVFYNGVFLNGRKINWSVKSLVEYKNRILLAAQNRVYSVNINGKTLSRETTDSIQLSGVKKIVSVGDSICYLAGDKGLFQLKEEATIQVEFGNEKFTHSLIDAISIESGIWLLSETAGVFHILDGKLNHIEEEDGLLTNEGTRITGQGNEIWLASPGGTYKIMYDNGEYIPSIFSTANEFSTSSFSDIELFENRIYIATDTGLVHFDKDWIRPSNTSYFFDKINCDGFQLNSTAIPYDHGLVEFDYETIQFNDFDKLIFEYQLNNDDPENHQNWISSNEPYFQFSNLRHGDYRLESRTRGEYGDWVYATPLHFSVNAPFWMKWYFYLGSLIISIGVALLIFVRIKKSKERFTELTRGMIDSEMKALRAQINPHFLFNSLNSIKRFILTRDINKADIYLTDVAALMRELFEQSDLRTIPMDREIRTLELYLEIEQMRFSDAFTYEIQISEEVDEYTTNLPAMIIQPFVENAIWHGLMPKDENGKLRICFDIEGEDLNIQVIDNGGGFVMTESRKGHTSSGVRLIKERLALMDEYYNIKTSLDISSSESGTAVTLKLPLSITFE